MTYWTVVARTEILCELARHDEAVAEHIIVEARRAENRRLEMDLHVRSGEGADPIFSIVSRPADDDVLAWLVRAARTPQDKRCALVHAEETTATRTLRSLAGPHSPGMPDADPGPLASVIYHELGPEVTARLPGIRLIHRPAEPEEQFASAVARHVCRDSAYADALLECLGATVQALASLGGRLVLGEVRRELRGRGILLEPPREVEPDLRADVLRRAGGTCCACRRPGARVDVRLINELPADHDPDNLAALCVSCWASFRKKAAERPTVEIDRLTERRREWDWEVAQTRREAPRTPAARPPNQTAHLHEVLRRHLVGDFHRDGPRRGEFARLGGRMEDRFYQPHRGERLTARPAYYHTYWGLTGARILLPERFPEYAEIAADSVADRLSRTGWITVDLEDYAAPPPLGRRRVQTIRHTARAAMILFLTGHHLDLATEVAWNVLAESEASMKPDGGWGEFRNEPDAPSTLYSSMYALQLLSSVCLDPGWAKLLRSCPHSSPMRRL